MGTSKEEFLVNNQNVVTKNDLENLRKRIESDGDKREMKKETMESGKKLIKNVGKGFRDIAKSLNTPQTNKRPRIAQIPNFKKNDITAIPDLEVLKPRNFRGRDIRGRKIIP